jgi:DNA polymerase III delta prime subunit
MAHWLQVAGEWWQHFSAWAEEVNRQHPGLLIVLALVIPILVGGTQIVVGVVQTVLAWIGVKPKDAHPVALSSVDPTTRAAVLDRVEVDRVNARLRPKQGLRHAIRLDLQLTETFDRIRPQRIIQETSETGPMEERATNEPIQAIFGRAKGPLLILGDPGTGKTNLLMELAEELVKQARANETAPVPVVFSLPRWTLGKRVRTLEEWMIDDLHDENEYGILRASAESLVRHNKITPLFDGLDEVAEGRRDACVEAIHAYQHERERKDLAVCCRNEEYMALKRALSVQVAIRVERLTRGDVERSLTMEGLANIRRALARDAEILEIIDTPLWLHVAVLAMEVDAPKGSEALPARDRLYARFVEYALRRKPEEARPVRTGEEDFKRWLGWLAVQMKQRSQREFAFEELDASWVHSGRATRWLVGLVGGLGFGLVAGLVFGLVFGPVFGLVGGLVGGLGFGLVVGLVVGYFVNPAEDLYFAWHRWRLGLGRTLVAGLVGGLVVGLGFGLVFGLVAGLVGGLVGGLGIGLLYVLVFLLAEILQPRLVSRRASPNRGTLRSLRNAGVIYVIGLALGVGAALYGRFPPDPKRLGLGAALRLAFFAGEPAIGALSLLKGGGFAIRHYVVRFLLWREGHVPLRYVDFLNEATDRLFLMRRGGTYEFFHLTFRDYMAKAHGSQGEIGKGKTASASSG